MVRQTELFCYAQQVLRRRPGKYLLRVYFPASVCSLAFKRVHLFSLSFSCCAHISIQKFSALALLHSTQRAFTRFLSALSFLFFVTARLRRHSVVSIRGADYISTCFIGVVEVGLAERNSARCYFVCSESLGFRSRGFKSRPRH